MNYQFFLYAVEDSVLTITMNRPEVRNAWNWEMHDEFHHILKTTATDDSIRALIITGAPPAFSSGTDLKAVASSDKMGDPVKNEEIMKFLHEYEKPIIAAINGPAIGAGFTLSLLCDIRIASESAKMCMRFTEMGIIPEAGSTYMLPRIAGLGVAMDLFLTARTIDAQEALRLGIVSQVLPGEELLGAATAIAKGIATKKPYAIGTTRKMLYEYLDTTFYEQLRREPALLEEVMKKSFFGQ